MLGTATAQQYFGGLTGTVTDGTGAVVPNATVTLTSIERGNALKILSNETGIYRAANLPPGSFRLEVEATGFKKFTREPVSVETSRVVTIDVALELGASSESVTVSSAAPILDAESSATNSTVEGALVDKIAVLSMGRFRSDTQYYLQQLPGSSTGSPTQERASSPVAVYGARSSQVGWDEDGMPNRSAATGANMHAHSVANEVVEDFRYTTVNANAESATPARISVVTRGGTNQFHGSAYLNAHNSWFDANDHNAPGTARKPVVKHYYKGFSVEGPVFIPKLYDGRNRTFFIASVEKYSSPSNVASYITVPTAEMRGGDFSNYRSASGALVVLKDPLTGDPLPNNTIPKSRIYSGAANWLNKLYPTPTAATSTLSNNAFGAWLVQNTDQTRYDIRADQILTPRNMLFFRFNQVTYLSTYNYYGTGANTSRWSFHTYQVNHTSMLKPNLLNEARFGISEIPNVLRTGVPASEGVELLGVQGIPSSLYADDRTSYPAVGITGISGVNQLGDGSSNNRMWNAYDNVTYIRGLHTIKMGADARLGETDSTSWPRPGTFSFTGNFTGFGLADFLLGIPYSSARDYPRAAYGDTHVTGWSLGWYVQDEYKLSRKLTLTFGLRWDANLPGRETNDMYYNFDPASGNLIVPTQDALGKVVASFPKTVNFVTASQAGVPARLRHTDLNNFVPRIGLAWRPLGDRTVVRAAYGIYNDTLSLGYLPTSGPWGGTETFINSLVNGVPQWQLPQAFPTGVAGQIPGTVSISAFDPDIANPYVQQWNLTLERQVQSVLLRAQYVGTKATNLYWYPDLNLPAPSTTVFSDSRRPYRQYGTVTYRTNGGSSTYHGLTLSGEKRMSHGSTFNSAFTWSKMLTDSYDGTGEANNLSVGYWFPTFQRSKWRGNATFNPKYRWTNMFYTELPVGRGRKYGAGWNRALDYVAGKWAVSGYFSMESGWWVSPYYSSGPDAAGVNSRAGVPDRIGDGIRSNSGLHPGQFFLDPAAFVIPAANIGRFGTSGTNFLQEPSWWRFDASAEKAFPIYERVNFLLRCHIVNPFNHGAWGHGSLTSGLNMSTPATFGTMAGQYVGTRQLAFEGRLSW